MISPSSHDPMSADGMSSTVSASAAAKRARLWSKKARKYSRAAGVMDVMSLPCSNETGMSGET